MNDFMINSANREFKDREHVAVLFRRWVEEIGAIRALARLIFKFGIVFAEEGMPIGEFLRILDLDESYADIFKNLVALNERIYAKIAMSHKGLVSKTCRIKTLNEAAKELEKLIHLFGDILGLIIFGLSCTFDENGFDIHELARLLGLSQDEIDLILAGIDIRKTIEERIKIYGSVESAFPTYAPHGISKHIIHYTIDELALLLNIAYYSADNKKLAMEYFAFEYNLSFDIYGPYARELLEKAGLTPNYEGEFKLAMKLYDLLYS